MITHTRDDIELLNACIDSWQSRLHLAEQGRYGDIKTGPKDCALCARYWVRVRQGITYTLDEDAPFWDEIRCDGCPIKERTGQHCCGGTPYEEFHDALEDVLDKEDEPVEAEELLQAIQNEITFLKTTRNGNYTNAMP